MRSMTKVLAVVCGMIGFALSAQGFEWNFAPGENFNLRVPHQDELNFPHGFKATIRFACDLSAIGRVRFANLVTKGRDFHDGWSIMVKKDGNLLVDLLGVEPQYHVCENMRIESNRPHLLEVYVMEDCTRIFLDGEERGSYEFGLRRNMANCDAPLVIGSMGGYTFKGSISQVKLEALKDVARPAGDFRKPYSLVPPLVQSRAELKWVRPVCAPKDRYIGWPTVCRLRNGEVIASFSGDREGHICPFGKVQIARSSDNGETWQGPVTIANGPLDDRDAGIVELPDGELLVTYFTSIYYRNVIDSSSSLRRELPQFWWRRHDEKIPKATERAALGYFATRSRDGGKTWSEPVRMNLGGGNTPHAPAVTKDGSLVHLVYSGNTISCWRSADGARTWECLCPKIAAMNDEDKVPNMFHEPTVIELADGSLLGQIRYHGPDGCLRQTFSKDGGRTWTPMAKTPLRGLPPHLVQLPDGKVLSVYGRRIQNEWGEYACLSDDGGKTWDVANEIVLANGFQRDLGYPSTCILSDGWLLTTYYQQPDKKSRCALMATKWRVTR